jgi:hypothetical protein
MSPKTKNEACAVVVDAAALDAAWLPVQPASALAPATPAADNSRRLVIFMAV